MVAQRCQNPCEFSSGRAVGGVGAVQTFDQTQVVHHLGHFGKDFADPLSTFTVLSEAIRAFHQVAGFVQTEHGVFDRDRVCRDHVGVLVCGQRCRPERARRA